MNGDVARILRLYRDGLLTNEEARILLGRLLDKDPDSLIIAMEDGEVSLGELVEKES